MVKLGWKAGPEQYEPNELLDQAIAAEEAGFEILEASDHINPWSEAGHAAFIWTWLGAAAARTRRIHLGTGVTCPILRYHPSVIAQAAATLEMMASGRTFLAVGTGEALNEYAATGMWPPYNERRERLQEAILIMRALWRGEEVDYRGTYYDVRKLRLHTRPNQPVPLYISSLVPDSAEFAGRYGDGLFTVGGHKPELYQKMIEQFEQGARAAGRDPSTMPKMVELFAAYTPDVEGAIQQMRTFWAGAMVPALYDQNIYTPARSEQNGEVVGPDTIRRMGCISDNAQDHVKFAQQYIDLGFDVLYFHSAGPDQLAFIRDFGRDVLPRIRESAGQGAGKQLSAAGA